MKTIILFLLLPCFVFSQPKEERKILSLLDKQTKAWNKGDFDGFMKGYIESDSLMYIGKSGVTYGFNATLSS